jgi:hypothetical protein
MMTANSLHGSVEGIEGREKAGFVLISLQVAPVLSTVLASCCHKDELPLSSDTVSVRRNKCNSGDEYTIGHVILHRNPRRGVVGPVFAGTQDLSLGFHV